MESCQQQFDILRRQLKKIPNMFIRENSFKSVNPLTDPVVTADEIIDPSLLANAEHYGSKHITQRIRCCMGNP